MQSSVLGADQGIEGNKSIKFPPLRNLQLIRSRSNVQITLKNNRKRLNVGQGREDARAK